MELKYNLCGIIGKSVFYSKSPKLYNDFFKENNLQYFYNSVNLNDEELSEFIKNAPKWGYKFFNITIPYKKDVLNFIKNYDEIVNQTQNVNLIVYENNEWFGFNTDYSGFSRSYKNILNKINNESRVLLVGTGGVAQTIYTYLKNNKYQNVTIYSLRKTSIPVFFADCEIFENIIDESQEKKHFDLVIFASSYLGENLFLEMNVVYDNLISVNYQTKILDEYCEQKNINFKNGEEMLLEQFKENLKKIKLN